MKLCPNCNGIAYYNPYFGCDNCTKCTWRGEKKRHRPMRNRGYRDKIRGTRWSLITQ